MTGVAFKDPQPRRPNATERRYAQTCYLCRANLRDNGVDVMVRTTPAEPNPNQRFMCAYHVTGDSPQPT